MEPERTEIGIVCGHCDRWSPMGTATCARCGNDLALAQQPRATPTSNAPPRSRPSALAMMGLGQPNARSGASNESARPMRAPTLDRAKIALPPNLLGLEESAPARKYPKSGPADGSQEDLMDQARNYVCRSCQSGVPSGHKFCGRCGTPVPMEILHLQTSFFGDMQNPSKAKLVLIRGEGMEGLSFHLKAEQHIVGRNGQLVFPEDAFVSPRHANFFYRDGRLVVRDEGSLNGVYVRVRGTVEITAGDTFMAGEQIFRVDLSPAPSDGPDPDGTLFYSSPKHHAPFRLVQMLQGGATGMTVCARSSSLLMGREGGDLNFPVDLYMSSAHCRIDESGGKFTLTDLNSRNGTYVRIKSEHDLSHGDYLFIGRKLLRVELNTN